MKSTGIVRKVDELGRIVLPKELRDSFDIREKDALEIFTEDDLIILKKSQAACLFCKSTENLKRFKGKTVCTACLEEIKNRQ